MSYEIEAVRKSLPTNQSSGPLLHSSRLLREKVPTFLKLSHKLEKVGILPNSFY
jgi:hypothetical protein